MHDVEFREEQRDGGYERTDEQAANDAPRHVPDDNCRVRHWRDQHLLDMTSELCAEK